MWKANKLFNKYLKPGPRYTQLDWSTNNHLITSRSELQRLTASQIRQDLQCARADSTTKIQWVTRNTQSNLSCRLEELKLWRSQIGDIITQVDQEISLLKKVKESAEACLQEKALYRQVLSECVTLRDGRLPGDLVHDHVEAELSREVQLCEDTKLLIQQKITEVLDQLRTLKEMRSELLSDQRDKDTAINVNSRCLTLDIQSPSVGYRYQPSSITKGTLTYEQWISHCQNLKESAEKVVLDSSYFRSNLQHKFSELINALDAQRSATDFSFRWRLDELRRAKNSLEWEKQQVNDLVTELQAEMQKVESQILSSGSEEQLAQTRLDILAQRLNHELCLDQPTTELQKETQSLYRNTFSLQKKLLLSQKTLEAMYRNLFKLEDGVKEKARSIEIDEKCQEVRQQLLVLGRMPMIPVDPADNQGSSTSAETLHDEERDGQ